MSHDIQMLTLDALAKNLTEMIFQGVMATHKFLNRDMYRATLACVKESVVSDYVNTMSLNTSTSLIEEYGMANAVGVYKSVWGAETTSKLFSVDTASTYKFLLKAVLRYIVLIKTTTYKDYCAWRALQ
jgi:hypothetical protein